MKAFLVEEGSELVAELLRAQGPPATSRIAYVECQAAFARGRSEARLDAREVAAASRSLDEHWPNLVVIEFDGPLTLRAGRLVHEHALRAVDAVHLASALSLAEEASDQTAFACCDTRLWEAASGLGFRMAPASPP